MSEHQYHYLISKLASQRSSFLDVIYLTAIFPDSLSTIGVEFGVMFSTLLSSFQLPHIDMCLLWHCRLDDIIILPLYFY